MPYQDIPSGLEGGGIMFLESHRKSERVLELGSYLGHPRDTLPRRGWYDQVEGSGDRWSGNRSH